LVRRAPSLAGVGLALTMLAACGSGPSQLGSGVIIGDSVITTGTLQQKFDRDVADRTKRETLRDRNGLDGEMREIIAYTVQHQMLARLAAKNGLGATDQQVDAYLQEVGGADRLQQVFPQDGTSIRDWARDDLLAAEYARRQLPTLGVTLDVIPVDSRAKALAQAAQLAAATPAQRTAIYAADQAAGATVQQAQQFTAADSPNDATTTPVYTVPAGTVVAFKTLDPQTGQDTNQWLLVVVLDRSTTAKPQQPQDVSTRQAAVIGRRMLALAADQGQVKLNPRFGVWDPLAFTGPSPAANDGEVSGVVLPLKQTAP
jgi:hypothetical protein